MKKLLFLLISFLTAFHVQAQIKLNTDGSVNLYWLPVTNHQEAGTVEIKGYTEVKKGTNLTITQ